MLSRRRLLAAASSLGAGGLLLPRALRAAAPSGERKFLFVYCYGGWDTLQVFTPMFGVAGVDVPEGAELAEANGIPFVDHPNRPSVRTFFETWGHRACVINGMEVRSVTHERCRRLLFTGVGDGDADDWAVTAAALGEPRSVPHLVLSGPAFTSKHAASVVRIGESGQLPDLLDGTALSLADHPAGIPDAELAALEDAYLRAGLEAARADAPPGSPRRLVELYLDALDNLERLRASGEDVDLDPISSGCRRDLAEDAKVAFNAFELGLSRTALAKDLGWCSTSWDTHSDNEDMQGRNFEELFGYLGTALADLETRGSASGGRLADEVTVVVLSEMGRHPQLTGGGRGHWTYTSALLIGAGVRGGQVIGAMDDNFQGRPVDLGTGQLVDGGTSLLPGHLGATLLELAGIDPTDLTGGAEPIRAAIS